MHFGTMSSAVLELRTTAHSLLASQLLVDLQLVLTFSKCVGETRQRKVLLIRIVTTPSVYSSLLLATREADSSIAMKIPRTSLCALPVLDA